MKNHSYTVCYRIKNDSTAYADTAYGANEAEALENFAELLNGEDYEIESIKERHTYTVYYRIKNDSTAYVGSAYGANESEALEYFAVFHRGENYEIESIKLYK